MFQLSIEQLRRLLVDSKIIKRKQFQEAVEYADQHKQSLAEVLVGRDYISNEHLGRVIAEYFGVLYVDLSKEEIPDEVLRIVPETVARTQLVVPFRLDKEGIRVAMADPENFEMVKWLEKKTGRKVIVYYATPGDIAGVVGLYRRGVKEHFAKIITQQVEQAQSGVRAEDLPIIKIVDTIVAYAYENHASDIHIEPLENSVLVRYRIDGILHDIVTLPKRIHSLVVTRIKVLAKLRTDQHRAAQDGKFRIGFGEEHFDVRVSIVPIVDGEKIVMRLLVERTQDISLESLGLHDRDLEILRKNTERSYGMILSTGPTGSGKTTTLYSIIKILNTPEINIATIEDPVEYGIPRVNQIQVNPKTGLTFAKGLRSIVRQDPDVIMVGEIRDLETASIAVNSAMTGHLVLSTLHTNDAATAFPRLSDMGVKAFLIASSVNIIVAQRLVRKICEKCIVSFEADATKLARELAKDIVKKLVGSKGNKKKVRLYRGEGCEMCGFTGYRGRTGIFEVIEMSDEIKALIMRQGNANQIKKQAIKEGMRPMLDDGIRKVLQGKTTIEEVLRVIS